MTQPDELAAYDAVVRSNIEEDGFHVIVVPEEDGERAYAFTVGLWQRHQHPELVISGLDKGKVGGDMHAALAGACEQIIDDEKRFAEGERILGLFTNYFAEPRVVHDSKYGDYLGYLQRFYDEDVPALQLVWPDKIRRWPWDEGFDGAQDLLFEPKA